MNIFKLFFNHDLRLDQFGEDDSNEIEGTLEDFMTPTLTLSRFYLTGTVFEPQKFGLSKLQQLEKILEKMDGVLKSYRLESPADSDISLADHVPSLSFQQVIIARPIDDEQEEKSKVSPEQLNRKTAGFKPIKKQVQEALRANNIILFKEKARDGYDLQILSMKNIYEPLFHAFKDLLSDDFRFFSINSKRINSRRKFFFETISLETPPHGVEEVDTDTVLYR